MLALEMSVFSKMRVNSCCRDCEVDWKWLGWKGYGYQIMDRSRHTTTKYLKASHADRVF